MTTSRREYNKTYREKHRDDFNATKKRNYAKGRVNIRNYRERWTDEHDAMVIAHDMTDRELGKLIGRSVQAIQMRRWKLTK